MLLFCYYFTKLNYIPLINSLQKTSLPSTKTHQSLFYFEMRMFLIYLLLNHALSIVYKLLCQQLRPSSSSRLDFGMPSSHGMYAGFVFGYFTIQSKYLFVKKYNWLAGYILVIGSLACIIYSRIYFEHHSIDQLAIGVGIGLMHSIAIAAFRYFMHSFLFKWQQKYLSFFG